MSTNTKFKIKQKFSDVNILIIDEISMYTPVTMARIDRRLRDCLNSDQPFGGLHVILLGEFWQFEPVSFLSNPALYQGLVLQARGRRIENNDGYVVGVNLFSQFKVFWLEGQQRYKDDADFLKQLRALEKTNRKYPIDSQLVSKLEQLTRQDVLKDETWEFATIATPGNVGRMNIIQYQAKRYGMKKNEQILRWQCPVRKRKERGRNVYEPIDLSLFKQKGQFCILNKYFIRGAKCVLDDNISTSVGIAKGTTRSMEGLVWRNDENKAPDISNLPRGEFTWVPQPEYMLIKVDERLVAEESQMRESSYMGRRKEI